VDGTDRLTIEPRAVAHAPGLFAALDHPDVGRFIGGPDVTTLEALVERIVAVDAADPVEWGEIWLNWVVMLRDPARTVIGRVEATVYAGVDLADIAYVFGPRWAGNGYATEATAWMLDQLRDHHGVATVYATTDPANGPSTRLLERLGFERNDLPDDGGARSYDPGDHIHRRRLDR